MSPPANRSSGLLPVRAVLRRTGLSADVLRAWERRYRAVQPHRSSGGQRLYREEEVERLERLRRLTILGHSIGQIASLSNERLDELLAEAERGDGVAVARGGESEALLSACLGAAERMDGLLLDATLRRAAISLGALGFAEQVLFPFMHRVGELWHRGVLRVGQEHFASATVRSVLNWLAGITRSDRGGPVVVLATPPGERHELGIMMAACIAAAEGWRGVYLGADVPVADIADAAGRSGAQLVALGIMHPTEPEESADLVRELRSALAPDVKIVVGGRGAEEMSAVLERAGARVTTMSALRAMLQLQPAAAQ